MSSDRSLRAELVESARRWLAGAYGEERRRRTLAEGGFDAEAWREMAALGWLGIAVPEEQGGLGLSLGDLSAVVERIGASNLPEPVAAVAGVAAPLLAACATRSEAAAELLAAVLSGERVATLAHGEPESGFARDRIETRLSGADGALRLDGAKAAIEGGGRVDVFLVSARSDEAGTALVLVERECAGVTVTEYRALDGRLLADLRLEDVRLPEASRLPLPEAAAAIDEALDRGALLAASDAVGAMAELNGDTLAHLKSRRQFGQPLGAFQALQHRAVDMAIALEEARAVVAVAAEADGAEPGERRRAVATAKVVGGRAARRIGRDAVQLHGGMGITDELRVSHLFRRLVASEGLYGDGAFFLDRYRAEPPG